MAYYWIVSSQSVKGGCEMSRFDIDKLLKNENLSNSERNMLAGYFSKTNLIIENDVIGYLRIVVDNSERFYSSEDVSKMLGYKTDVSAQFTKRKEKMHKQFALCRNKTFICLCDLTVITECEFLSILQRCRTKNKDEKNKIKNNLVKNGLLKDVLVLEDTKEQGFIQLLLEVLEPLGFTISRQYPVLRYRIDAYIHDLNIAIEYDENGHAGYSYESHELRQKEIENYLGCKFIRVTDDKNHTYNVGLVLKQMWEIR